MFSNIGPMQLGIVLLIVILIFGTKRLGNIGKDLGGAVKGFRKAMNDADKDTDAAQLDNQDAEFSASDSKDNTESKSDQKV